MFVRTDARNNIVEATDMPNGKGYLAATGEMPLGLLGFNGRVYTPNYRLVDGVITNREASDIAREPYSDPAPVPETERLREDVDYLLIAELMREGLL
mgnify:CR=1 FL=1|jgi:hypothetical protein